MYMMQFADTLVKLQALAYSNTVTKKLASKDSADTARPAPIEYKVDNIVAYCDTHGFGRTHKLTALWNGPSEIIEKKSTQAFTIKNADTKEEPLRKLSCHDWHAANQNYGSHVCLWLQVVFGVARVPFLLQLCLHEHSLCADVSQWSNWCQDHAK
ncbi:hypothetical protein DSO57_1009408 [Entomophthora muscae]|uniref:Uncharacterized protein n=1 Tax=Entomophthora muscae TaxID=34485 RepID=A0ACC2U4V2_9FUNG|nr:hypothetical protein DSO57_1009408 [Entomophthora muscae]